MLPFLPSIRHMLQRPTMLMRAILAICRIDICIPRYTYHFIIHRCQISSSRKLANVDRARPKFPRPQANEMGERRERQEGVVGGGGLFSELARLQSQMKFRCAIRYGNGTLMVIYKARRRKMGSGGGE